MNPTLIVNLFGGPGSGKSTLAAETFGLLKRQRCRAELVTEYAKELVWIGEQTRLNCQPRVTTEQLWRLQRLVGKVEVVLCDSPLLLGSIYAGDWSTPAYQACLREWHERFWNLNVLLRRDPQKVYDPAGRQQTQEQAEKIDQQLTDLLIEGDFHFVSLHNDPEAASRLVPTILYTQQQYKRIEAEVVPSI